MASPDADMPPPGFLSVKEVAGLLGISKKAAEMHVNRGRFPNVQRIVNESGRVQRVWVSKADLEAYADKRGITLAENVSRQ
jgi:predicted DNA-binding transcriptional regulator AlpA